MLIIRRPFIRYLILTILPFCKIQNTIIKFEIFLKIFYIYLL